MHVQQAFNQTYSLLETMTNTSSPRAQLVQAHFTTSFYDPNTHSIGIASTQQHYWDVYFEEISHAIRHQQQPREQLPLTLSMIVHEFFGGLGRNIGRTYASKWKTPIRWLPHNPLNRSRSLLKNPKKHSMSVHQTVQQQPSELYHELGYLLADFYVITPAVLPALYKAPDKDIHTYVFGHIKQKHPAVQQVFRSI
ncbi:MAG: hypothetical protein ACMXYC_00650 [Candidatus Woesearchaeota archaeon]